MKQTVLTSGGDMLLYTQQTRQAYGRKVTLKSGGFLFSQARPVERIWPPDRLDQEATS